MSPVESAPAPSPPARIALGDRTAAPIGPPAHVRAERERLAACSWAGFDVRPLAPTFGGELSGVDLAHVDDDVVAEIRRALLELRVLVFRGQDLSSEQHLDVARRFGELEVHPFLASGDDEQVVRFAKDGTTAGYENVWHSDVSWRERPAMGAVLRAVQVPDVGGDTLFADMVAAYDGLDEAMRRRLEGLRAVHDFAMSFGQAFGVEPSGSGPRLTLAGEASGDDVGYRAALRRDEGEELRRRFPPVEHPVVRTHEETGRRLVYVNPIFTSHVVGLPPDEGEALLRELFSLAEVPEYQLRIRWEPGTVVFWDNRAVQHYACSDYWPAVRVMERAAIAGTRPV